ncbi:MAG: hypothetical protein ABSE05_07580 [Syntrophales bacterium]|jgi:hypothetical protein
MPYIMASLRSRRFAACEGRHHVTLQKNREDVLDTESGEDDVRAIVKTVQDYLNI